MHMRTNACWVQEAPGDHIHQCKSPCRVVVQTSSHGRMTKGIPITGHGVGSLNGHSYRRVAAFDFINAPRESDFRVAS